MSSIIEGYNYDIFISYRQKDNKHDGWVTEFVENLKGELESTFKESISVYFDINPHDGLLETHDVDASLKDKLKCLVFIPIISRTYCDPKSFAWEHEFKAFVELASQDQVGLKVKLPYGNVASRVLPIRINELDEEDIKLLESCLGFIRSIDFIYRSQGVNRPLRKRDDDMVQGIKQPVYRDQINKVANAISEIITGLKKSHIVPADEKTSLKDEISTSSDGRLELIKGFTVQPSGEKVLEKQRTLNAIKTKKKTWIFSTSSSFVVILAAISFFIFSSGSTLPFSKRDWVIITDFENLTKDPVFDKSLYTAFSLSASQSRYINLFPRSRMFETLKRMEIKDKTFIDEKTGREIAIREEINLYIVPSISEVGNRYTVSAKIMETKSGNLLKSEISYAETQDEILSSLDQLSKKIRRNLGESRYNIAMQDKHLEKVTTSSLEALRFYTLGIEKHAKSDFEGARDYYENALRIDTGFTAAKASLGGINIEEFDPVKGRELLSQAVKTVDKLTDRERLAILSFYAVNVENNIPKGIKYERMRIDLYPDDAAARNNIGWYYHNSGEFEKSVKEYKEAIRINPNMVLAYNGLLWTYLEFMGNADSALVWSEKMISNNPQNVWSHFYQGSVWICFDSISKAIFYFRKAREINPEMLLNLNRLAYACNRQHLFDEAIQTLKHILEIDKDEVTAYYYLGVNYQSMENQKEALKYFSSFKKIVTQDWMKNSPNDAETYFWQGAVSARLGDMDFSQQMLLKAIKIDSTKHERLAELLCLQGKIPEALDELNKSFENGYRNLLWLKLSPDLEILQYDIRFRDLMDNYFKQKSNLQAKK